MKKRLTLLAMAIMVLTTAAFAEETAPVEKWDTGLNHIQRVQKAGLMGGYPDGTFHPEGWLTRAELAHIVVKAFDLDKRPQTKNLVIVPDVPSGHWAYNDIQTVLKAHIMKGYHDDGRFYPNQKVTRAEAYAILAQAYGVFQFTPETEKEVLSQYPDANAIPGWAQKAVATALHEGFVNAGEQSRRIHPLKPMTRGDMAYALSRYLERQFDSKKPVTR